MTSTSTFPFSAVVGSEELKRALLMNLVDPRIGGVLIRGDRGTAKSTIVRALAALLPAIRTREGCPVQCDPDATPAAPCLVCGDAGAIVERAPRVVDLPLGATEDRVAGSIDLARALSSGERRFEAGLLGGAHRGVLYVDEVNLLPDHLVDLLLDVAASGVNVVERDGASATHPARFIFVGTMNPEEGDLRPQLLDRFGLVVDARTPTDPETRAEVVRRRIAFDADPAAFLARFAEEERSVRDGVLAARRVTPEVRMPEAMLNLIVGLCIEAGADGLRADITLHRAAAALTALAGRVEVMPADVYDAALLVLPHRQHAPAPGTPPPPDVPSLIAERRAGEDAPSSDDQDGGSGTPRSPRSPDDAPDGAPDSSSQGDRDGDPLSLAPDASPDKRIDVALPAPHPRSRMASRGVGNTEAPRGRQSGTARWDGRSHDIAVVASVIEAARSMHRPPAETLRMHRRRAAAGRLVLLVVDTSGSMGARDRITRTRAALRSVLDRIYLSRDRVALQAFRAGRTEVIVAPRRGVEAARAAIEALPTGGGTPVETALRGAAQLLRRARLDRPGESSLLVLVTDGRTRDSVRAAAVEVGALATQTMVLDTETGTPRLGRARQIAAWLGASYEPIG